jgi:hypothetical protein
MTYLTASLSIECVFAETAASRTGATGLRLRSFTVDCSGSVTLIVLDTADPLIRKVIVRAPVVPEEVNITESRPSLAEC